MKNEFHWKKGLLCLLIPITFIVTSAWVSPDEVCEEVVVTKLIQICGNNQVVQDGPPPVECDQDAIVVEIVEECYADVPLTIYMTNVISEPEYDVDYELPPNKDAFYVQHEAAPGLVLTSGPFTTTRLKGEVPVGQDYVNVFGIDLELMTMETNETGCPEGIPEVRNFPMNVRLFRMKEGMMEIYPVEDEADAASGLFSCEIFLETNCECDPDKPCDVMPPDYDLTICLDCNCGNKPDERLVNPNSNEENSAFINQVVISPNPLKESFNLSFSLKESAEAKFNIVDHQGKVITDFSERLEAGDQSKKFDTRQFADGIYYLQIITEKAQITEKLLILDK